MTIGLTPDQHQALSERIREMEAHTTGEIYCVVARRSDSYFLPAAFMLAAGMLVVSLPLAWWLDRDWLALPHIYFAIAQATALAAGLLLLRTFPRLSILLVPRRLRYRRAHENALRQFFAHNIYVTERRTGVLIFVSLAERYAEVVADAGINAAVEQPEWDGIVTRITAAATAGRLAEGLSDAIGRAGALLATHFPGGVHNPNELDDHVVEI